MHMHTHCPLHVIYVNALPCKAHMLQIVLLRSDWQYQIAHLCIINSTKDTMKFNNFVVKHFTLKTADNKVTNWWA